MKKLTYIDLFAGCGGLSLGLHHAGWKGVFAIEKSPDAFKTLKHNLIDDKDHFDWPDWLPKSNHEIDQVLEKHKENLRQLRGKIDLVAGGPPCQGFSTAGRRKEDDIRNGLIRSYLKFIMYVRPKLIFFENVKGFTQKFEKNKSKGIAYAAYVLRVLKFFGYQVEGRMIDFSKYGIPQKRTRFILVGVRNDIANSRKIKAESFFDKITTNKQSFLNAKGLPQNPTLSTAISDLLKINGLTDTPDRKRFQSGVYSPATTTYQQFMRKGVSSNSTPNSHSFPKHSDKTTLRFKRLLKEQNGAKNISDAIRKELNINKHVIIPLSASHVSPTITTLPDDYVHYSEPRILTVREYARIQSFPDWYQFQGKYTTGGKERTKEVPRYTQIGNAIPPLFGEQAGLILNNMLNV